METGEPTGGSRNLNKLQNAEFPAEISSRLLNVTTANWVEANKNDDTDAVFPNLEKSFRIINKKTRFPGS
jgi:hypothetical protein